jgi:hypothetical protein
MKVLSKETIGDTTLRAFETDEKFFVVITRKVSEDSRAVDIEFNEPFQCASIAKAVFKMKLREVMKKVH